MNTIYGFCEGNAMCGDTLSMVMLQGRDTPEPGRATAIPTSPPGRATAYPTNEYNNTPIPPPVPSGEPGGLPTATPWPTYEPGYPGYTPPPPGAQMLEVTATPACTTLEPCYYTLQLQPMTEIQGAAILGVVSLFVLVHRFVRPTTRLLLLLSMLFVLGWYFLTLQGAGLAVWVGFVFVVGVFDNITKAVGLPE